MGNPTSEEQVLNDDRYVLPRNELERKRLERQHVLLTELLGGRLIVDKDVKLGSESLILDSGTGGAPWILGVLKNARDPIKAIGIDISAMMFPKDLPSNITLFEMSCLSLPEDWSSSFDLINQRLLIGAFTETQWLKALSELFRVLRPGGAIQLIEVGQLGSTSDLNSLPATKKAVGYSIALFKKRGIVGREIGRQLPTMLEKVGFSDIQVENHQAPLGKQWGDIGVRGSQNWGLLFRRFGNSCLEEGGLDVCSSKAEVDDVLQRAKTEWDENTGVFIHAYAITARKPL